MNEIDRVVSNNDENKSLGLDVFNFPFIKSFWDILCPEVGTILTKSIKMQSCQDLHLLLRPTHTKHAISFPLGGFWPIFLSKFLYKIPLKVLASWLSNIIMLDLILKPNQLDDKSAKPLWLDWMMVPPKVIQSNPEHRYCILVFSLTIFTSFGQWVPYEEDLYFYLSFMRMPLKV